MIIITLTFIWGSAFILVKKALIVFNPGQVFAGRTFIAILCLLPIALKAIFAVPRKHWPYLIFFAVGTNVAPIFLYALAQTHIESALVGLLNAITPLMTLIIGVLFFKQGLRKLQILGVVLGLIGVVWLLLIGSGGKLGDFHLYAAFAIIATVFNGFSVNILKFKLVGIAPLQITALAAMVTAPLGIGYFIYSDMFSLILANTEGMQAMGILFLLATTSNILGLILLTKLIQISNPVFASLITYLIPIVALFWGILDGESIGLMQLLAAGVIIGSVYLANRKG